MTINDYDPTQPICFGKHGSSELCNVNDCKIFYTDCLKYKEKMKRRRLTR